MQTLKLIFAIVFLLAGVFVGGCSFVFGAMIIAEGSYFSGGAYDFSIVPTVFLPVGLFLLWAGWALLRSWRNRPRPPEPPDTA